MHLVPGGDVAFRSVPRWQCAFFVAVLYATSAPLKAEVKQLLTPEACTEIRYLAPDDLTNLSPLQLSPDGKQVAYVLQVPDVEANDNEEELYVKALDDTSSWITVPVLINQLVAAVHWFPDNRNLAVLIRDKDKVVLARIDSVTKRQEIIWKAGGDITDYSMDASGESIAIAVREEGHTPLSSGRLRDNRKGYRLDLESISHSEGPRRHIYILRVSKDHHWTIAQSITFISPLSGKKVEDLLDNHSMHISLSPDGHYLLMDNVERFSIVPQDGSWGKSPVVRYMRNRGFEGVLVSYLYDLRANKVSMPLESPLARDGVWAPDSKSYVKLALAPVGSRWEASDLAKGRPNDHATHLFAVDVRTGEVSEVLERGERPPIAWTKTGDIIVRDPQGSLATFRKEADQWKQIDIHQIPLPNASPYSPLTSDGRRVVTEYESARTAPQLVAFDPSSGRTWIVAKLDPQADGLLLPQTEAIAWTTPTGFKAKGLLLLPPDYDPHRRYPLVIEDGSITYSGEFVCDSGVAHVSSFVRGILADAGIVYLMRYWPGIGEWENNYYPKGYPGALAEAAFKLELVESAVKSLDERGIIDPSKVGLIGFSRGGWYVDYALTHSQIRFRAATTTDNIQYSMGEYWYWHNEGMVRTLEGMYGGPPYGKTLKNWLNYSISFNLDKIHTPLLMEVMGYGKKDDDPDRPPDTLAVQNEIFVGLSSLKKPVELYYYPDEQHQPDHPQARIASLQRNVDWYRFWLQNYEDSDPAKKEQYKRWEHLRELHDADIKETKEEAHAGRLN